MTTRSEELADELFTLMEYDQGFSYISDGMGNESVESIIEVARVALAAHERCAKQLRRWIKNADARYRESAGGRKR